MKDEKFKRKCRRYERNTEIGYWVLWVLVGAQIIGLGYIFTILW